MTTVFLVSCVSAKRPREAPGRELYISEWFKKARAFVTSQHAPWFILSAEHGLVHPDAVVAPYEKTLNTMSITERRAWAKHVIEQMDANLPMADGVVFLAGARYREFLIDYLRTRFRKVDLPMEGLKIGEQLHWLSVNTPGG